MVSHILHEGVLADLVSCVEMVSHILHEGVLADLVSWESPQLLSLLHDGDGHIRPEENLSA